MPDNKQIKRLAGTFPVKGQSQSLGRGFYYSRKKVVLSQLLELLLYPLNILIPSLPDNARVRKILIVEPFVLGDAALLSVMLDPLRNHYPGAEIHMLIQPSSRELYSRDSRVTKVHSFLFPWAGKKNKYNPLKYEWRMLWRFVAMLRSESFDIGIDTRGEIRSQILLLLMACRKRAGFTNYLCSNLIIRGLLLTDNAGNVPLQHRTSINLQLCRLLGCKTSGTGPARFLKCSSTHADNAVYTVVIHPGGGWQFKLWQSDKWAGLLRHLHQNYNLKLIAVGSSQEKDILNQIRKTVPDVIDFRTTDLQQLIDTIQQADLFICLDSGPMNIASMLGRRVLALFGPGIMPMYAPEGQDSMVVHRQQDFECAPCSQQLQECIYPHHNCMAAITVREVIAAAEQMIPGSLRKQAEQSICH